MGQLNARSLQIEHPCCHLPSRATLVRMPWQPGHAWVWRVPAGKPRSGTPLAPTPARENEGPAGSHVTVSTILHCGQTNAALDPLDELLEAHPSKRTSTDSNALHKLNLFVIDFFAA